MVFITMSSIYRCQMRPPPTTHLCALGSSCFISACHRFTHCPWNLNARTSKIKLSIYLL